MTLVEAYAGEIRLFANTFAPRGWALCDGRLVSVDEYPVLFALIGATYGGDGVTTFGLPDLRGRLPLGADEDSAPGAVGAGVPVASGQDAQTPPTVALNYIICLQGVYPDYDEATGPTHESCAHSRFPPARQMIRRVIQPGNAG